MSIVSANKFKTLDGSTYSVPVQVVVSSLGTGLGNTTSDLTNLNVSWYLNSSSTSWVDTSNLQLTITPKFSSSLIKFELMMFMGTTAAANTCGGVRVKRNTTIVWRPEYGPTGAPLSQGYTGATALYMHHYWTFTDSPATTAVTTYSLQVRSYNGTAIDFFARNGDYATTNYFIATEYAQ